VSLPAGDARRSFLQNEAIENPVAAMSINHFSKISEYQSRAYYFPEYSCGRIIFKIEPPKNA
jgi:hypothetical protein